MNEMDSRKPVRNLAESIHSLLGFKEHLTSAWVSSVCSIIRNLPSEAAPASDFKELSSVKNVVDTDKDVIRIKDELAHLLSLLNQLNAQRRQLLSEFLDLKGNIRVFCRIKPTRMWRDFNQLSPVIALNSNHLLLQLSASKSKHYCFDKLFHPNASQDEIFSDIEPIIKSVVDGYNACIFAYGQTGSGKTYTMEGTLESPGVVQRGIEALFKQATVSSQKLTVTFSMLEIYLGNLKDLLVPHSSCISVQTNSKGGIEMDNLTSVQVSSSEQALKLYTLGRQLRATATTNLNKTSSRSHCMIRIKIESVAGLERRRETSKLWMVDLGGSERVLKTKAHGRRFEEGKSINLSLSALGDVVDALQRRRCHIPYRNSKLTLVLQDCLGEDSKTLMLVHVSPEEEHLCESVCSLNFAMRARSIQFDNRISQEAMEHKKTALISLQQKMEQIEDKRLGIKRKIETVSKTLESVANASDIPSIQLTGDPQLSMVASKSDSDTNGISKVRNLHKFPPSELPRFMQPTVCSRRKYGSEVSLFEEKSKTPARSRRRSIRHRANSVSFPMKRNAAYSSNLSTSSVVDLNTISNVDNVTECSQDTSECGTGTIEYHMQGKTPTVTVREQKQTDKIPLLGKKEPSFELPMNANETDYEAQLNMMSTTESPKSIATNSSDVLCHSSTDSITWTKNDSENRNPKVDQNYSRQGFPLVLNECTSGNDILGWDESATGIYNDNKHSRSQMEDQLIHTPDSKYEKYGVFSEPLDDSESMDASFQGIVKIKTRYLNRSRSHRALFTDELKEEKVNVNTPIVHSRGILQCKGVLISIKLKIQMLYFCVLMWLGIWNLGYEDELFHSLTH